MREEGEERQYKEKEDEKEGGMSVAMVTGCRRSLGSCVCSYKLYNTGSSSIIKEDVPCPRTHKHSQKTDLSPSVIYRIQ